LKPSRDWINDVDRSLDCVLQLGVARTRVAICRGVDPRVVPHHRSPCVAQGPNRGISGDASRRFREIVGQYLATRDPEAADEIVVSVHVPI
jgi:hypothetical protein